MASVSWFLTSPLFPSVCMLHALQTTQSREGVETKLCGLILIKSLLQQQLVRSGLAMLLLQNFKATFIVAITTISVGLSLTDCPMLRRGHIRLKEVYRNGGDSFYASCLSCSCRWTWPEESKSKRKWAFDNKHGKCSPRKPPPTPIDDVDV